MIDGRDLLPLSCFWAEGPAMTDSATSDPVIGVSISVMDLGGPCAPDRPIPFCPKNRDIFTRQSISVGVGTGSKSSCNGSRSGVRGKSDVGSEVMGAWRVRRTQSGDSSMVLRVNFVEVPVLSEVLLVGGYRGVGVVCCRLLRYRRGGGGRPT
jgi:hypothetical protein